MGGRVRLNVILCNFFTFKTNTFSIIENKHSFFSILFFLLPVFILLFWYSYNSFRLHQFQTFQNTNETYKYKYNPSKQILFLFQFSSFINFHHNHIYSSTHNVPTKTHSHRQKHTKTASTA